MSEIYELKMNLYNNKIDHLDTMQRYRKEFDKNKLEPLTVSNSSQYIIDETTSHNGEIMIVNQLNMNVENNDNFNFELLTGGRKKCVFINSNLKFTNDVEVNFSATNYVAIISSYIKSLGSLGIKSEGNIYFHKYIFSILKYIHDIPFEKIVFYPEYCIKLV